MSSRLARRLVSRAIGGRLPHAANAAGGPASIVRSQPLATNASSRPQQGAPACAPFAVRGLSGSVGPKDEVKLDIDKEIEEEYEHITGLEREEVVAEKLGLSRFEPGPAVGPFGTVDEPAIIESVFNERLVGCTGGEGDDEHDPVWMRMETGKTDECPDCGQIFKLVCVGEGGYPYTGHLKIEGGDHAVHH